MKVPVLLLTLACVIPPLAGCSNDNQPTPTPTPTEAATGTNDASANTARLYVKEAQPNGADPEVAVGGAIEVNEANCVTMGGELLAAPSGSKVTSEGVILAGYGEFKFGESLESAAGGNYPVDKHIPDGFRNCATRVVHLNPTDQGR